MKIDLGFLLLPLLLLLLSLSGCGGNLKPQTLYFYPGESQNEVGLVIKQWASARPHIYLLVEEKVYKLEGARIEGEWIEGEAKRVSKWFFPDKKAYSSFETPEALQDEAHAERVLYLKTEAPIDSNRVKLYVDQVKALVYYK